ncbi:MAG: TIGR04372 family glycosyltransferase, partial [Proteobacteria bacterium]|nr:TIGR04372 family glycosyltransferase [Pseudomonadota bacterium]
FRNDRPYKETVLRLMPQLDLPWRMNDEYLIPLEAFDFAGGQKVVFDSEAWKVGHGDKPDLVLTPWMMKREMLPSFDTLARFQFPEALSAREDARLRATGLDPNGWFCVLHYREGGYEHWGERPNRDLNVENVVPVIHHVTKNLGGQVVRVGHSGMSPMPKIDGFFDLASAEDPAFLHAYAISRSRYFLELSPSGPYAFAMGFGVPMARCGAVVPSGPVDEQSIVLPQHVVGPDNKRVPLADLLRLGLLEEGIIDRHLVKHGYRLEKNSVEEFKRAAEEMLRLTENCPGWRDQQEQVPPTHRPNKFEWPMRATIKHKIIEYPDLAPNFGTPAPDC